MNTIYKDAITWSGLTFFIAVLFVAIPGQARAQASEEDRSVIVQLQLIERCERQSRSCTLLRFGHGPTAPTLAVGATAASRLQQALMRRPAVRER